MDDYASEEQAFSWAAAWEHLAGMQDEIIQAARQPRRQDVETIRRFIFEPRL